MQSKRILEGYFEEPGNESKWVKLGTMVVVDSEYSTEHAIGTFKKQGYDKFWLRLGFAYYSRTNYKEGIYCVLMNYSPKPLKIYNVVDVKQYASPEMKTKGKANLDAVAYLIGKRDDKKIKIFFYSNEQGRKAVKNRAKLIGRKIGVKKLKAIEYCHPTETANTKDNIVQVKIRNDFSKKTNSVYQGYANLFMGLVK